MLTIEVLLQKHCNCSCTGKAILIWFSFGHLDLQFIAGIVKRFAQRHILTHSQAGASVINIQSTLHTTPDLCKNVSHAVLFGSNNNSYTVSMQSVCVCIHIFWLGKEIKLGQQ
jgi:hypothetical protein